MGFLVIVGCREIYLSEYLIKSYIILPLSTAMTPSGYIAMPPSTTSTWPVM